jgi:hypothetical protein
MNNSAPASSSVQKCNLVGLFGTLVQIFLFLLVALAVKSTLP